MTNFDGQQYRAARGRLWMPGKFNGAAGKGQRLITKESEHQKTIKEITEKLRAALRAPSVPVPEANPGRHCRFCPHVEDCDLAHYTPENDLK
jgi:hypothetical protein